MLRGGLVGARGCVTSISHILASVGSDLPVTQIQQFTADRRAIKVNHRNTSSPNAALGFG
jgi:hypothetical protein